MKVLNTLIILFLILIYFNLIQSKDLCLKEFIYNFSKNGEICKTDSDCELNLKCVPSSPSSKDRYICKDINYSFINEGCENDEDCIWLPTSNVTCKNYKCYKSNNECFNDIDCPIGYLCNKSNQTCIKGQMEGKSCSTNHNNNNYGDIALCNINLICNNHTGLCEKNNTITGLEGIQCLVNEDCRQDLGLYCKIYPNIDSGICTKYYHHNKIINSKCNNLDGCGVGDYYNCNLTSQKCIKSFPLPGSLYFISLYNLNKCINSLGLPIKYNINHNNQSIQRNNKNIHFNLYSKKSIVIKSCFKEWCDYINSLDNDEIISTNCDIKKKFTKYKEIYSDICNINI